MEEGVEREIKTEETSNKNEGFQPGKYMMFEEEDALKSNLEKRKEKMSLDDLKPPSVHYATKGEDEKTTFDQVLEGARSVYEYTTTKLQEGAETVIESVKETIVGKSEEAKKPTRKEAVERGTKKMEEEGGRQRSVKEEFHPDHLIPSHKFHESHESTHTSWDLPQDKGEQQGASRGM